MREVLDDSADSQRRRSGTRTPAKYRARLGAVPRKEMVETMKGYTVRYERDEGGWWVATVPRIRSCHTQGRTLDEARRRIREALALFIDNAERVELRDEIELPNDVQKTLRKVAEYRHDVEKLQKQSAGVLEKAIKQLTERLKLSTRDQADLLGLSHQRIHQIKQKAG